MSPNNTYHGGSMRDISLYKSPYRLQSGRNIYYARGRGLGNVLRGIFQYLAPMLKAGTKAVGQEVLKGSAEVLQNMGGDRSFSSLVKEQKEKTLKNLENRAMAKLEKLQKGNGLRIKRKKKAEHQAIRGLYVNTPRPKVSPKRKASKKTTRKRLRKSDIFD